MPDEARGRHLRTVVHRPPGDGLYPLVVLAHGLGAGPGIFRETAEWLASRGYVAAAVEFPVTTSGSWDDAPDVNNQPADVSVVIDSLTAELDDLVDAERVAVVGHSLGAVTSLMIGFHSCCRDDRVDAVAAWAGGMLFGAGDGRYFDVGAGTPLLLVHGDGDQIVRYLLGEQAYHAAAPPKYFLTLLGGDHVAAFFLDGPYVDIVRETTLAFLDAYVKDDAAAFDRFGEAGNVEGVATLERAG